MNPTDPRLQELLEQRSHGVRVAVDDLAERAIARDRSRHRHQVGTVLAVMVAVVAVLVPFGRRELGHGVRPPVPAGPSHSMSPPPSGPSSAGPSSAAPTITATGAPGARALTPAAGEVTGSTDGAYLLDGVFHDGARTVKLPASLGQPASVARLADGARVVVLPVGGAVVLDSSGASISELPEGVRVVVAEDLTHFASVDASGTLTYHDALGGAVRSLPGSTCDCSEGEAVGTYDLAGLAGTTVYASRGATGSSVAWDAATGARRTVAGEVILVHGPRQVALVRPVGRGDDHCYELRELDTGHTRWALCGPLLIQSFSHDGQHLVGTGIIDALPPTMLGPDGTFPYGSVVVLRAADASVILQGGDPQGPGPWPGVAAMLGDDLTLTVRLTSGSHTLQRCTLAGECSVVGPARPPLHPDDPELGGPYLLSDN
jgi:hypothetical protein